MTTFLSIREPRAIATAAGLLLAGTIAGFIWGRATAPPTRKSPSHKISLKDNESETDVDSDHEGEEDLQTFADRREECKLVLIARTDLGMTKGTLEPESLFPS